MEQTRDLIVLGASAGGVEALRALAAALPADLPAAVCLVIHLSPDSPSRLPEILTRSGPLPAEQAEDRRRLTPGHIFIAPPDYHLLVEGDLLRLARTPKVNRARPAIDPLFRSAADARGPRVIGAILSGTLDDGVAGLLAISAGGGITMAQQPDEALYKEMPQAAITGDHVHYILPVAEMATTLARLTREVIPMKPEGGPGAMREPDPGADLVEKNLRSEEAGALQNAPTVYACPSCGGTLWEVRQNNLLQFRCRIGHLFSPESLLAEHSESVETALWSAVRALEENASLQRRLATRMQELGHDASAARYADEARLVDDQADVIREQVINAGFGRGGHEE